MEGDFGHRILLYIVAGIVISLFAEHKFSFSGIWKSISGKFSGASKPIQEKSFWEKEEEENISIYTPIYDRSGLEAIKENVAGRYILMEDIDLSDQKGWNSIGDFASPFRGRLNGNGHIIKGAEGEGDFVQAIFGYIGGDGVVYDLHVQDVKFQTSGACGGIAVDNAGTIARCSVTGEVTGETAGGIAGHNSGALIHCQATCRVEGQKSAGGVAGINDGLILACHAGGCEVTAGAYAGGLIGMNSNGAALFGSYSVGALPEGEIAGALVGNNQSAAIVSCYATLTGWNMGGLLGVNENYGTVCVSVSPSTTDEEGADYAAHGAAEGYNPLLGYDKNHVAFMDDSYELLIGVNVYSSMTDAPYSPFMLINEEGVVLEDAPTVVVDDEGVITFASGRMWKASGLWKGVEDGAPSINLDYEGNASRYISSYTSTPPE